mmetsp:Transcript_46386/g.110212  ORF Transcript_46386/g.110212 Transcript_46386/m.110212 type:complete len:220 (+) Transcript_46386:2-661(+)
MGGSFLMSEVPLYPQKALSAKLVALRHHVTPFDVVGFQLEVRRLEHPVEHLDHAAQLVLVADLGGLGAEPAILILDLVRLSVVSRVLVIVAEGRPPSPVCIPHPPLLHSVHLGELDHLLVRLTLREAHRHLPPDRLHLLAAPAPWHEEAHEEGPVVCDRSLDTKSEVRVVVALHPELLDELVVNAIERAAPHKYPRRGENERDHEHPPAVHARCHPECW